MPFYSSSKNPLFSGLLLLFLLGSYAFLYQQSTLFIHLDTQKLISRIQSPSLELRNRALHEYRYLLSKFTSQEKTTLYTLLEKRLYPQEAHFEKDDSLRLQLYHLTWLPRLNALLSESEKMNILLKDPSPECRKNTINALTRISTQQNQNSFSLDSFFLQEKDPTVLLEYLYFYTKEKKLTPEVQEQCLQLASLNSSFHLPLCPLLKTLLMDYQHLKALQILFDFLGIENDLTLIAKTKKILEEAQLEQQTWIPLDFCLPKLEASKRALVQSFALSLMKPSSYPSLESYHHKIQELLQKAQTSPFLRYRLYAHLIYHRIQEPAILKSAKELTENDALSLIYFHLLQFPTSPSNIQLNDYQALYEIFLDSNSNFWGDEEIFQLKNVLLYRKEFFPLLLHLVFILPQKSHQLFSQFIEKDFNPPLEQIPILITFCKNMLKEFAHEQKFYVFRCLYLLLPFLDPSQMDDFLKEFSSFYKKESLFLSQGYYFLYYGSKTRKAYDVLTSTFEFISDPEHINLGLKVLCSFANTPEGEQEYEIEQKIAHYHAFFTTKFPKNYILSLKDIKEFYKNPVLDFAENSLKIKRGRRR